MDDYLHPRAVLADLPAGIAGTRATLAYMSQFVQAGKRSPFVRQIALQLTGHLQQKDFLSEVKALHAYVRDQIRYVRDVSDVETLQTADRTIQNRAGDCDDKSILLASLLETLSHPTRFVAVGFSRPGQCEHVYIQTRAGGSGPWISAETTEPVPLGWNPAAQGKEPQQMIVMEN